MWSGAFLVEGLVRGQAVFLETGNLSELHHVLNGHRFVLRSIETFKVIAGKYGK